MMTFEAGAGQYMALQYRFSSLMEPYRTVLQAYCRSIARSAWEADDLAQDTWMKAYRMFLREPARAEMSKTYLFRIAQNTWIDRCRQQKRHALVPAGEAPDIPVRAVDPFELREAMETLIANLPARQRVMLMLVDALGFTALETARLVGTTEGAVKAGLHRARAKLKSVRTRTMESWDTARTAPSPLKVDEQVVYAYLEAFQQHNPYALVRLLNEETAQATVPAVIGIQRSKIQGAQAAQPSPLQSCFMVMAA